MIEVVENKYFLAIEYSNRILNEVLQHLLDKQECLCNWEDDYNCDECQYLSNLYYGVKHNLSSYLSVCVTWKRGFSNQISIENGDYLQSNKLQADLKRAKEVIRNKIKQLRFVKSELGDTKYYVENLDRIYIFATDEFILALENKLLTKFKGNYVYLFSAIKKNLVKHLVQDLHYKELTNE